MSKKIALLAFFAFAGFFAVLGWNNVIEELPNYIAMRSLADCTFGCGSYIVQGFWSVVAFTALFSAVSVGSLIGFVLSFENAK